MFNEKAISMEIVKLLNSLVSVMIYWNYNSTNCVKIREDYMKREKYIIQSFLTYLLLSKYQFCLGNQNGLESKRLFYLYFIDLDISYLLCLYVCIISLLINYNQSVLMI